MVVTRSQARAAAAAAAAAAGSGPDSDAVTKEMAALKIDDRKAVGDFDDILKGEPEISDVLYKKASKDNKSLSKLERILLFSRCDVLGKAFADPASLTEGQRNIILNRPTPEIMAKNIRDATDGAMSTIGELMSVDVSSLGKRALTLVYNMYQTSDANGAPVTGLGAEPMAKKHDPVYFLCHNSESDSGETEGPVRWAMDLCMTPEEAEWEEQVSSAYWVATEDDDEDDDDDDDDTASTASEAELPGYREEKERLEPEMRAQLADKVKRLTDAERAELVELVRAERERNKAEDDAFSALLTGVAEEEA